MLSDDPECHKESNAQKSILVERVLKQPKPLCEVEDFNNRKTFIRFEPLLVNNKKQTFEEPVKAARKIAPNPFKILDAPGLQDDFYLNLVDWSSQNILAVALESAVYVWNATTSTVSELCDLADSGDQVTSLNWSAKGGHLSVGTKSG